MLVSELADTLLLWSGQHIAGDLNAADLDIDKFWKIMRQEIYRYDKYSPVVSQFNIYVGDSYTFTEGEGKGIPEWISKVIPINISIAPSWIFKGSETSNPLEFTWRYVKPTLYTYIPGNVEVRAVYKRAITEIKNSQNVVIDYDIEDISFGDTTFLDLCHGRFLISLGGSRRAFNIDGLPITSDGPELISEGKELFNSAKRSLQEDKQKWYLSLGS